MLLTKSVLGFSLLSSWVTVGFMLKAEFLNEQPGFVLEVGGQRNLISPARFSWGAPISWKLKLT